MNDKQSLKKRAIWVCQGSKEAFMAEVTCIYIYTSPFSLLYFMEGNKILIVVVIGKVKQNKFEPLIIQMWLSAEIWFCLMRD